MACGSVWYEGNPELEKKRDELSAQKHAAAAEKIGEFFAGIVGKEKVTLLHVGTSHDARRILLQLRSNAVCVEHRGHSIIAHSETPEALAEQFSTWRKREMTHARVFFKAH